MGNRRKRWLVAVLALAVAGTALSACQSSGDGDGSAYCPVPGAAPAEPDAPNTSVSGAVTVWGWNNAGAEAVLADFKKAYPNVTVKLETVGYPNILPKLTTALQAGTGGPDIAFLQDADAPSFWELPIADLSRCMKPHLDDFPAFKVKAVSRPDGTIQAVPWEAGPAQLLYRRDIFSKYGIDPTSLDTWEEFTAAGQKLFADSNNTVFMNMSNINPPPSILEGMSQSFRALMQQNGGNLWDAKGNPTFDDPRAIEALELIKTFRDKRISLTDVASDQAAYDAMTNGTVATFIAPTWWTYYPRTFSPRTAGLWGGVPLPAFKEGGARSTNVGGTGLVIPRQTDSGEAAWAFLNFWLLRGESRKLSYDKGGYLFENIYKPIANDPIFNQPDEFVGGDRWLHNAAQLAPQIPQLNTTSMSAHIDEELTLLLPAFIKGEKTAAQTLSTLQNALKAR